MTKRTKLTLAIVLCLSLALVGGYAGWRAKRDRQFVERVFGRFPAGVLAAPTITSVIRPTGETSNTVTWSVSNKNVESFDVEKKVGAGSYSSLGTGVAADRQIVDASSAADGTYTYRVRCIRGTRVSAWSNEASIVVSSGPPDSSLLHEADFTYAGAFKMPLTAGGVSTSFTTAALTLRNTAGTDRLISTGYSGTSSRIHRVYEVNIPALTLGSTVSSYNTASVYKAWGLQPYGSLIQDTPDGNGMVVYGLFWDATDSRLYWSTGEYYQNAVTEWPSFGYCTLDDASTTATPVGWWGVSGVNAKMVKTGILRIPNSSFITANCPGKPLAAGFGSGGLSVLNGHSLGPAFFAIPAPDTGTYASGTSVPKVELLSYPWNQNQPVASNPLRARRDNDYKAAYFGPVTSATSNTVVCGPNVTSGNNIWGNFESGINFGGYTISITAGTGAGQTKTISGAASGHTITIVGTWDTIPDATSTWEIPWNYDSSHIANSVWNPNGDVGYWTAGDVVYQSATWVKNSGKEAIVVFVTFATGRQFYGSNPNGPVYEGTRHEIWLYDPADLAAVAQGTKTDYTVEPYERFDVTFPWVTNLGIQSIREDVGRQFVGGVTLNAAHTRLYFSYQGGYYSDGYHAIVGAYDLAQDIVTWPVFVAGWVCCAPLAIRKRRRQKERDLTLAA